MKNNLERKIRGNKTFYFDKFELSISTGTQFLCVDDLYCLKNIIEKTLRVVDFKYYTQISLSIVTPGEIRDLNNRFRGIDRVTDVLSFPLDMETGILGDVVICKKVCAKQAKLYGNSFQRELMYLTCHSILHLMGYDHMNKRDKRIMRDLEKKVMREI